MAGLRDSYLSGYSRVGARRGTVSTDVHRSDRRDRGYRSRLSRIWHNNVRARVAGVRSGQLLRARRPPDRCRLHQNEDRSGQSARCAPTAGTAAYAPTSFRASRILATKHS